MAIIMHPLTAKNGSPEYTADDYRHAINPLLVPSDGTAFNGLSGVRYGSPSPLVTVSGLTVTVKPHCGTISPWDGLGAYTYAITTDTTVQLANSTNDYKIAVTVEDPSQSHGATPRGQVEVFTAGTPDSNINGLVIAEVNAGVASDVAPMIRNSAILMARDLEQLNTIDAVDGQEAVTITDNAHYERDSGQWVASYYYQHWTNWDLFINYLARIVRVECNGAKTGSGSWDSINAPFKIPAKCVPKRRLNAPVVAQNGGSTTKMLSVSTDGTVSLSNQGGAGSVDSCLGGITYIY
nr:MAG: hypothetical protein [Bacteriophage sp.]